MSLLKQRCSSTSDAISLCVSPSPMTPLPPQVYPNPLSLLKKDSQIRNKQVTTTSAAIGLISDSAISFATSRVFSQKNIKQELTFNRPDFATFMHSKMTEQFEKLQQKQILQQKIIKKQLIENDIMDENPSLRLRRTLSHQQQFAVYRKGRSLDRFVQTSEHNLDSFKQSLCRILISQSSTNTTTTADAVKAGTGATSAKDISSITLNSSKSGSPLRRRNQSENRQLSLTPSNQILPAAVTTTSTFVTSTKELPTRVQMPHHSQLQHNFASHATEKQIITPFQSQTQRDDSPNRKLQRILLKQVSVTSNASNHIEDQQNKVSEQQATRLLEQENPLENGSNPAQIGKRKAKSTTFYSSKSEIKNPEFMHSFYPNNNNNNNNNNITLNDPQSKSQLDPYRQTFPQLIQLEQVGTERKVNSYNQIFDGWIKKQIEVDLESRIPFESSKKQSSPTKARAVSREKQSSNKNAQFEQTESPDIFNHQFNQRTDSFRSPKKQSLHLMGESSSSTQTNQRLYAELQKGIKMPPSLILNKETKSPIAKRLEQFQAIQHILKNRMQSRMNDFKIHEEVELQYD